LLIWQILQGQHLNVLVLLTRSSNRARIVKSKTFIQRFHRQADRLEVLAIDERALVLLLLCDDQNMILFDWKLIIKQCVIRSQVIFDANAWFKRFQKHIGFSVAGFCLLTWQSHSF